MTRTPESHRFTATVCASEAEARRLTDPAFAALLDTWAANQRARADALSAQEQRDLFT